MADLEALTSISYSNQDPFITDAIAPVISYTIDGVGYTMAKSRWGFWTSYDVNEKVTVLYTDPDHPEINRFFPYWLRLGDMYWIFGGAVLGTILTETVQFYKNQKKGS
ncbi:hypothetical protein OGH69_14300 [Flavobacterium sp. MFBS3-15]|uniref:hypothetical protein n=1 Tax=Flavobacterium sp. MFBS3-15 TaxID=2989816 RepID=UPI002235FDCE|nr:hypothetical protein [Flavobacterium sp. MFBS3-15]MCW4470145.1 hypothetical protein [Flavobacterium sp. MFBS3-15]